MRAVWAAVIAAAIASGASAQDVTQQTGKIVFFRPGTLVGAPIGCPIRNHEREIVELGRNKFAEWVVPKGQYILTNKTSSVVVMVEPGQTSYVRCAIKMGVLTHRADLQLADKETFEQHAADYERKEIVIRP